VRDPAAGIATLAAPIGSLEEFLDPNVVKVVTAARWRGAVFQSRADPVVAGRRTAGLSSQRDFAGAMRHVGLYAYRVGVLRRMTRLPPSGLEQRERLEQLRALESGVRIVVGTCTELPLGSGHRRRPRAGAPDGRRCIVTGGRSREP